jgi:ZIP family zinc transporter
MPPAVRRAGTALAAALPSGRRLLGAAVFLGGVLAALQGAAQLLAAEDALRLAFLGGLAAALATALGTLPVLLAQKTSERAREAFLGFGAGVMLAASAFSLIVPGLAAARGLGFDRWAAGGLVGAAILIGALLIVALDGVLPQEALAGGLSGAEASRMRRTWLFVFAIVLHNVPEGLAIGVGFAATDPSHATALATGIALQDVPEGLVIAVALLEAGYGRGPAIAIGAASGLVEPLGAILGALVMGLSQQLLPWGLGVAAGAMLFVICHEVIPAAHRPASSSGATAGLLLGFVLMMLLDTALG